MSAILRVRNLQKSYGKANILNNLNFEIEKGEFFGLIGHNGAGKSTTIDCILGMKPYDHGDIKLMDYSPKELKKSTFEKIGVQFQQSNYPDGIKVWELCELTASYYKKPDDWKLLLASFGLSSKEKMFFKKLSGGEKQKLSVLLTLIPRPEIIFLDELTTGLDTLARRQVWNELIKLKKKKVTVLLTSHYMDEVEVLCDRVAIMRGGEIAVIGTVKEIIARSGKSTLEDAYLWYTEGGNNENLSNNV